MGIMGTYPGVPKGPKWENQSVKRESGSFFILEAPKDGDLGYPGVPTGPKWENQSVKRGSGSFFILGA